VRRAPATEKQRRLATELYLVLTMYVRLLRLPPEVSHRYDLSRAKAAWARLIRKVSRASSRRVTTLALTPGPSPVLRARGA